MFLKTVNTKSSGKKSIPSLGPIIWSLLVKYMKSEKLIFQIYKNSWFGKYWTRHLNKFDIKSEEKNIKIATSNQQT